MTSPFDAGAEALGAAVPGAQGWFRLAETEGVQSGSVNVHESAGLVVSPWADGAHRLMTQGTTALALDVGPYTDAGEAEAVAAAVLALAYDTTGWPAA